MPHTSYIYAIDSISGRGHLLCPFFYVRRIFNLIFLHSPSYASLNYFVRSSTSNLMLILLLLLLLLLLMLLAIAGD